MTRPTQRMLDWQWQEKIGLKDRKTLDGHQSVYFNRLMDLAQPVEENDAVTKKYTDDLFNQLLGGILDMFEFDINGNLLINANALPLPTGASEAAKQDIGNASLASIAGIHVGGGGVITHNGTSQTITVPATAKSVRLATKGGATNFGIDLAGNATATSPGYIPDECIDYYPIAGSQTLKVYGTAGYCYYYFLG